MNSGKLAMRLLCSSPIEPELSMMNKKSTLSQPLWSPPSPADIDMPSVSNDTSSLMPPVVSSSACSPSVPDDVTVSPVADPSVSVMLVG